jgi:hypothetical protein
MAPKNTESPTESTSPEVVLGQFKIALREFLKYPEAVKMKQIFENSLKK